MTFPVTRWTLIQQAIQTPSAQADVALSDLCQMYADPVFAFIRRRVDTVELAEDLMQEFFADLLNGKLLGRADPEVGRFRSFLLHALRGFLADRHDYRSAQKRGGQVIHVSLAATQIEPRHDVTAEQQFELRWIRTLLARAIEQLGEEYQQSDRAPLFETLKGQLDGNRPQSAEVAEQLGMSDAAVRVALHRMRKRLGEVIREQIAESVPGQTDVDDELQNMKRILEQ